jgi:hypothetical protein
MLLLLLLLLIYFITKEKITFTAHTYAGKYSFEQHISHAFPADVKLLKKLAVRSKIRYSVYFVPINTYTILLF